MSDNFSLLVDRVSAAMTVSTLRHQVISTNIANHGVDGQIKTRLVFDEALQSAFEQHLAGANSARPADVRNFVRIEGDDGANTGAAALENEMVALSSNSLRYQALARMLNRYFAIGGTIATGGKG